jgi:large subunit ribosomal protein L9
MKVILKEYVYKHGVAGDVVEVADGFARNYLIPRGLAVKATAGSLRDNQHLIGKSEENRARLRAMENEAASKIDGVELVFGVKAGKNNKLYGSVTTRDIAEALHEKTGVDINRRRISDRQLRELGVHEVPVRLSATASPLLRVVILRDEEVQPYLRGEPVASLTQQQTVEYVEVEEESLEEAVAEAELEEAEVEEQGAETEA